MKYDHSLSYEGAEPQAVYDLTTDKAFRDDACEQVGASEYSVEVEPNGEGDTVTIVRTVPAEMPDFIKKLVGDTVKVKQTEKWGAAAADGTRTADVKVSVIGQPAELVGTATIAPVGGGTSFTLKGEVKVSIPFIGKKIEPELAKAITASLDQEVEYGKTRL